MKIKLFIICCIASLPTLAQVKKVESTEPKSKIEALSEKTGSFSKKEIVEIGKAGGVRVNIMTLTDLTTNLSTKGIQLEGTYSASYGSSEKVAYLDADEVDSFLKVINYINEKVFTSPVPESTIEYNFYARGGFSGGAYNYRKAWKSYVKLEKYDSNSYFFLDQDDFKKLTELILEAKGKL